VLSRYPTELVIRAAQYLFVKETKSSYQIEGLQPDQRRTARFVELLRRAGSVECASEDELTALQRLIVDQRYAAEGFRQSQNYVGQNLGPGRELIHYVPAKPEDVRGLMNGWEECTRRLAMAGVHPVVAAAFLGFGFVFIHPFEDGNGRLHRFLIRHALAVGRFTPEGVIFPVSAVMLREKARYGAVLESYSREVMRLVEYQLDEAGVLTVLNDTALRYRYPDLTRTTEELFAFIRDTIDRESTAELEYLVVFDAARCQLAEIVDMPDSRLDLFIRLCLQGRGRVSRNKRACFDELTDDEVERLEAVVQDALAQLTNEGFDEG
jgi:Fic family protein